MPTLAAPLDGHVSIRANDLPKHLGFLRQSLSNVPVPEHIDADRELCDAFQAFYRQVCLFHMPDRMAGDTYCPKGVSTPYASQLVFHDQRGTVDVVYYERVIATITRNRYQILRAMYFATKRMQPQLWQALAVRSCHEEIVTLHMRYHAAVRKHHPHYRLTDLLSAYVEVDCQLFMSPFATSGQYHYTATFTRDTLFGALRGPYCYRWRGVVVGAPPPTLYHVNRSLVYAMASCCRTRTPTAAVLILPEITQSLLGFAMSLSATTLIARFTHRGGVHGQRGQRFVVVAINCEPPFCPARPPMWESTRDPGLPSHTPFPTLLPAPTPTSGRVNRWLHPPPQAHRPTWLAPHSACPHFASTPVADFTGRGPLTRWVCQPLQCA